MKIQAIVTKDKVYITSDDGKGQLYYNVNTECSRLLYDGECPVPTYDNRWFSISKIPEKVEKKIAGIKTNYRWELKKGYPPTELMPAVLMSSPYGDESPYQEVCNLYTGVYDTLPDTVELVEVEWDIIAELPNYTMSSKRYKTSVVHTIDKITTPPVLLSEVPCKISGQELYKVIREHVKRNIDGRYARVTSDYDFSFTVMKSLRYNDPIPYKVTEGTGRKQKTVTKYNTHSEVRVFNMGDNSKGYGSWPEPITADNYDELEKKVDSYLRELMEEINKPLMVCPTYNGSGACIDK